jgi:hypothetical protein
MMTAFLLLSLAVVGQVKSQPADAPAIRKAAIAPQYAIYKVRHEGLVFHVRGYYRPDLRRIVWDEGDAFNRQTYSTALVSQPTFGFEQDGTSPGLVVRPLIASFPASSGGLNERAAARLAGRK